MENLFIVLLVFLTLVLFKLFNRNNEPFGLNAFQQRMQRDVQIQAQRQAKYNNCVEECKRIHLSQLGGFMQQVQRQAKYNNCVLKCKQYNQ